MSTGRNEKPSVSKKAVREKTLVYKGAVRLKPADKRERRSLLTDIH